MTKEEVMKRRLERAAERERLVRKNYMLQCRRMISYQIENFRIENNLLYCSGLHIDHVIPFALIVDEFRSNLQRYYSAMPKQDKLPTSISEFSGVGKWFMKYHNNVAILKAIPAEENLAKASSQTRKNFYGLDLDTLLLYKNKCKEEFLKLTNGIEVFPYEKRIIKPENRGRALQCYGNVKEKTNEFK